MTYDAGSVRRRYLTLLVLRWFPVGLTIPITVLLPLSRGLSLTEVGLAFSAQGILVLALELPTGGLSDSWGRKRVLLVSSVFGLGALGLLAVADSFVEFLGVAALMGVYRALDSGPLEAWYVDETLGADPATRLERGLSLGGTVLSGSIATGALLSGGLIALDPFSAVDPLTLPVLCALGIGALNGIGLAVLMVEHRTARSGGRLGQSIRDVPRTMKEGLGLVRRSRALTCLIGVELFWGFGMITFEGLMPVRLAEVVDSTDAAAALMGPVGSAAWFASAGGAALIPLVSRRLGIAPTAAALRVLQGGFVIVMGVLGGPIGLITAFLACYAVHGASSPMHMTLLHHEVSETHRSTVISLNSMVAQPAGALGTVVLTALADGTSTATALVAGGLVLALAAPLYLPAWRAEQRRGATGTADVVSPEEQAALQ